MTGVAFMVGSWGLAVAVDPGLLAVAGWFKKLRIAACGRGSPQSRKDRKGRTGIQGGWRAAASVRAEVSKPLLGCRMPWLSPAFDAPQGVPTILEPLRPLRSLRLCGEPRAHQRAPVTEPNQRTALQAPLLPLLKQKS